MAVSVLNSRSFAHVSPYIAALKYRGREGQREMELIVNMLTAVLALLLARVMAIP